MNANPEHPIATRARARRRPCVDCGGPNGCRDRATCGPCEIVALGPKLSPNLFEYVTKSPRMAEWRERRAAFRKA